MSKRVLVAEDEEPIREMISEMLERAGYEVETASDGPTAFSRIRGGSSDLVLLDVWMSGETGLQVLEALEAGGEETPRTILITGDDRQETRQQAEQLKAYRFLEKPFQPKALLSAVEEALA